MLHHSRCFLNQPALESRARTAREKKWLRKKEDVLLKELIFLRDIWATANTESMFFMFQVKGKAVI